MTSWAIQIQWGGRWITVADGFKSRSAAEWETAVWKQQNNCTGDPFRRIEVVPTTTTDDLNAQAIAETAMTEAPVG